VRGGLRLATGGGLAAFAILAGAGTAAAQTDPVFDPADADELATTLAEAAEGQNICYGWSVSVSDPIAGNQESVGSNFGAGKSFSAGDSRCRDYVRFDATVTYTSESSESEDSASYSVSSSGEVTTADLDSLELVSEAGLVGDNLDVDIAKAVAALPQLAADAGLAKPIEATPAAEGEAGDGQLTDDPGSDFWRQTGMVLVWGGLLVVGGVVFGIYAFRSSRRTGYVSAARWAEHEPPPYVAPEASEVSGVPAYVPPEWQEDAAYRQPAEESTSDSTEGADTEPTMNAEPTDETESVEETAPAAADTAADSADSDDSDDSDSSDDTEPPPATPPKP